MGILDFLFGKKRQPAPKRKSRAPRRPKPQRPPESDYRFDFPENADWRTLSRVLGVKRSRLAYLLFSKRPLYHTFSIPKADGGQRTLQAPERALKFTQRKILRRVLSRTAVPEVAHGFCAGRCTKTNAQPHVGARTVVHLDIEDFFPTIHFGRVRGAFQTLGFSRKQAVALAALTTFDGRLPQGAPTSPAIANLISRRMDSRLAGLARRAGAQYTRYADDMTFSGDENVVSIIPVVRKIVEEEGFKLREKKTRVMRRGRRQMVTGVVVNSACNLPRFYRRRLRAIVHNIGRNGWQAEARGVPGFESFIRGHLSYLADFHPEEAARLRAKLPT